MVDSLRVGETFAYIHGSQRSEQFFRLRCFPCWSLSGRDERVDNANIQNTVTGPEYPRKIVSATLS